MRLAQALKILQQAPPANGGDELRVALACGFMPLHLQTFLAARLRLAFPQRRVEVEIGLYGDFLGNLERLPRGTSESVALVMEWPDLDPRLSLRNLNGWRQPGLSEIVVHARARIARIRELINEVPRGKSLVLQLPTLPLPPLEAGVPTGRSSLFQLELRETVEAFAVWAAANPAVKIVNSSRLDRISPSGCRFDVQSELLSGFPYTLPHADAVSDMLVELIRNSPPKKGLITDLDDTLWKGILGEVGPDGVSWDLDQKSHLHAVYQELLRSFAETGVLLAVASKNDAALVERAFLRPDILLPQDRVFPLEVHWGLKSDSVSRVLRTWNIGAESVVFVDDSPLELAEVKSAHPAIECILFPHAPQETYGMIECLRNLFAKPVITDEDRLRMDSIRAANYMQKESQIFAGNPDAFLEQAQSKLIFSFDKAAPNTRVLELLNKTNQFNLNGKRYTEASLDTLMQDPCIFLMKAAYSDRFAPLGNIAVMLGRITGSRLQVLSWVMSCRAFSRRIEHAFLEYLFRKFDIDEMEFDYLPTEKNKPLQDFFTGQLGAPPEVPVRILREHFRRACPNLFHQVEEEA
jgi:FkbH-like protein